MLSFKSLGTKIIFILPIVVLLGCQNSQQFGQGTSDIQAPSDPSSPAVGPSSPSEVGPNGEAAVTPPPHQEGNPSSNTTPGLPNPDRKEMAFVRQLRLQTPLNPVLLLPD